MDKTPETKMYTTILRKYHTQARSSNMPKKTRMFRRVAFIIKYVSEYKPNPIFWNSLKNHPASPPENQ